MAWILLAGRRKPAVPGQQGALVPPCTRRWIRPDEEAAARGEGEVLVNLTGNLVDVPGNGYDRDWLVPVGQEHSPSEVLGLCGGACVIRHEAWQVLRDFREDLLMHYEDTDLSWRLRERGRQALYVREAVVCHDYASSSGTDLPMFIQVNVHNRILTAAAHNPASVTIQVLARTLVCILCGPQRGPVLRGLTQALAGLPCELHWRARSRARGLTRSC